MRIAALVLVVLLCAGCGTTESTTFTDVGDQIDQDCLQAVRSAERAGTEQQSVDAFDEAITTCDSFGDLDAAINLIPVEFIEGDVRRYTQTRCDAQGDLARTAICQEVGR